MKTVYLSLKQINKILIICCFALDHCYFMMYSIYFIFLKLIYLVNLESADLMKKLILVSGNDGSAVKEKATELAKLIERENNCFAFETISCDVEKNDPITSLNFLMEAMVTPSFFSDSKSIWLKHFTSFELSANQTQIKEQLKNKFSEITEYFDNLQEDENLTLLIDGPKIDKRSSFYKYCEKNGIVHELNVLNQTDKNFASSVYQKIKNFSINNNVKISADAVNFLTSTSGTDTGKLYSELEKLVSYVGEAKVINYSDCLDICSKTEDTAIWVFTDSLLAQNSVSAFKALDSIIDKIKAEKSGSSQPEMPILHTLISKFTELIDIKVEILLLEIKNFRNFNLFKDELELKKNQPAFLNFKLCSYHPFRAFKLVEQCEKFTDSKLISVFKNLLNINKEFVTGCTNPRIALENLIVQVCSK